MKSLLILSALMLVSLTSHASTSTSTCTSKDFDAATSTGQQLIFTFNGNKLVQVEEAKGSWGCSGTDTKPKLVSAGHDVNVYSVDFGCSDFMKHARVILSSQSTPADLGTSELEFTYQGDNSSVPYNSMMDCK